MFPSVQEGWSPARCYDGWSKQSSHRGIQHDTTVDRLKVDRALLSGIMCTRGHPHTSRSAIVPRRLRACLGFENLRGEYSCPIGFLHSGRD